MSSTYSTNLAIELIGSGEQAGNWGSTTNTNLGTLIEQAISGYTTYSCTGGTDTLSMTNGASCTARNMTIELTGTGGGTLVVPGTSPNANTKLYFIYNSTALAITVKVSGQTGVSVPAGAKISLVCNGTDVVTATNYMVSATLPNATLASPTMTGTPTAPTAAVGTNTTQVATTAFVQAAGLTGEIKMWGTASAPAGYLICNGAAVSRSTYSALYAVYGTTFGAGDGTTTFNVPDFSGKMPIGVNGTYALAATGGSATTTLITGNLPSHTHTFSGTTGATDVNHTHQYGSSGNWGSGSANAFDARNSGSFTTSGANSSLNHTHTFSGTTDGTGSGTAATTISPYLGIYFIIKT